MVDGFQSIYHTTCMFSSKYAWQKNKLDKTGFIAQDEIFWKENLIKENINHI